ncbi:MAG: SRPBCC family protein [Sciscionella sp.]
MAERRVSATKTINAPAEKIFDILADPDRHSLIDGSGTVRGKRGGGSSRLELGSEFGMDMRMGVPYRIINKVVEFDENRLITWRHFGGHRWRWELRPVGENATEVTETFDWSTAPAGPLYVLAGFPKRNLKAMRETLRRLEKVLG